MTKLANLLDQVDSGTILLPEFQRGYVLNRDQVRALMRSLYLGYPVGSLLIWETETVAGDTAVRGASSGSSGNKLLLLDGQQRITSLYGVMRGCAPSFFEGNEKAFTGLRFNVVDENFEFYAPAKMGSDPRWVDVTKLYTEGVEAAFEPLKGGDTQSDHFVFMKRLTKLEAISTKDFHDERLTGKHMTMEVVVDIFNRVNSGGTKLSTGDLALATICAAWPEARGVMRGHLERWAAEGFDKFNLDWLLRNINAVATGRAPFSALESVSPVEFKEALEATVGYIDTFLSAVIARLGLDHSRVLLGHYAFPVVSRFLHLRNGAFSDAAERDRMLFWYLHSGIWGRYAGSTETVLARDYEIVQSAGVEGLIEALERSRGGNLTLDAQDFAASTLGSRFYPVLYMLTRVESARDFGPAGLRLQDGATVHYLFPKSFLTGYGSNEANAVANLCLVDKETGQALSKVLPSSYLPKVSSQARRSQWIPDDAALWQVERYPDFLASRRELLAAAANSFLTELRTGAAAPSPALLSAPAPEVPDSAQDLVDDLYSFAAQLDALGFNRPQILVEIAHPDGGAAIVVADAYWPDGLQTGVDGPAALELECSVATLSDLEKAGVRVFSSTEAVLAYAGHLASGDG